MLPPSSRITISSLSLLFLPYNIIIIIINDKIHPSTTWLIDSFTIPSLLLFFIDITSFLAEAGTLLSNFRPDSPVDTNIHVYSSRVGQDSGQGWARSCDRVSSRRNVQNPRDGGHADIPENAHPRGTANPTKCAGL